MRFLITASLLLHHDSQVAILWPVRMPELLSFLLDKVPFLQKKTRSAIRFITMQTLSSSDPLLFDSATAELVLKQLSYDGYKDDGKVPRGYKFKVIYLTGELIRCGNYRTVQIFLYSDFFIANSFAVSATSPFHRLYKD